MIEVLPSESNRVTVDASYKDQLGNMRPVISYTMPEYTLRGVAYARQLSRRIYQRLGAADHTLYDPTDYGYVTYEGQGYVIRGGNHLAGTHIMGTSPASSVVDSHQRSWDHENLYLVGGGSMPSIGTSNITLTIAALCFRSARADRRAAPQRHGRRASSRGTGGTWLTMITTVEDLHALPARRDAARARDDPAVPDGAVLDPSRHATRTRSTCCASWPSRRCCISRSPPTS